ncbi:MAG: hypothetical protein ACOZAR_03780 [Patescibacteria group bacterium]
MKVKVWLLAFCLFLSLANIGLSAKAVAIDPNQIKDSIDTEKLKELGDQIKTNLEESKEWRCSMITTRIETSIARFDNNKDRHVQTYQEVKQDINDMIVIWKAAGLDTTKLEQDLQTFDQMILDLVSDYSAFIAKLGQTKDLACGEAEGQFKDVLNEARVLMKVVHQDILEIRNFYQTVIRVDLSILESQMQL